MENIGLHLVIKFSICIFCLLLLGMEYWFSLQLEFIFDIILVFSLSESQIINFPCCVFYYF